MATFTNVILIILGFTLLIFVHELGHFLTAKWAGIRTEGFAIGMGPIALAYRRGIGWTIGSTRAKVIARTGKPPEALTDAELTSLGIGETEYSLRILPLGGFVKMLGQEDANPNAVSDDPRSYTRAPIGKRMVVVSAGVVMNLILAVILFVAVFLVGVNLEAPVVGEVAPTLPAATTAAANADALGITSPGFKPGDRVIEIDGKPVTTFTDIQIAAAMGRLDQPINFLVERPGVAEPLQFRFAPVKVKGMGVPTIGVFPAAATTIHKRLPQEEIDRALKNASGIPAGLLKAGMTLEQVDGQSVGTWNEVVRRAATTGGRPLESTWRTAEGESVSLTIPVEAEYQTLLAPDDAEEGQIAFHALAGLAPLHRVTGFSDKSPNMDLFQPGDVIVRAGNVDGPLLTDLQRLAAAARGETLSLVVLRDGLDVPLTARVARDGVMGIELQPAWDLPLVSRTMPRVIDGAEETVSNPAATLALLPRTRLVALNGEPMGDWAAFREALQRQLTADPQAALHLTYANPTPGADQQTAELPLSAEDRELIRALGWSPVIPSDLFESVMTLRSADGNPFTAIAMGFEETRKATIMTYITIDRLIRRTVNIDQLRGPVGIVHLGSQVADRGFPYLVLLLAMISVNLAVLNFLPLPIVDGGLFLFLVYEKIRKQQPPLWFQNAATIAGLLMIGCLFLVTFYNDVMRLIR